MKKTEDVLKNKNKTLKCDQCGASDFYNLSSQLLKCKHCDAILDLRVPVVNNFVTNVYSAKAGEFSTYHLVKHNKTEGDFLREVAILLSINDKTPANVLEADFNPVNSVYHQYMIFNTHYEGFYSAAVGFSKTEVYKDSNNNKIEKDITDWHPFNGNISMDKLSSVRLGGVDNQELGEKLINDLDYLYNDGSIVDFEKSKVNFNLMMPSANETKLAIRKGEEMVDRDISLPGDSFKNYSSKMSHTIRAIDHYVVPEFEVEYKYKEDKCKISSVAYDINPSGTSPDYSKEMKKQVSKMFKPYALFSIALSVFVALFALFSSLFSMPSARITLFFVNMILMVLSIGVFVFVHFQRKKVIKKFRDNVYNAKLKNLNCFLSKNNLAELTKEELDLFERKAKGWRF